MNCSADEDDISGWLFHELAYFTYFNSYMVKTLRKIFLSAFSTYMEDIFVILKRNDILRFLHLNTEWRRSKSHICWVSEGLWQLAGRNLLGKSCSHHADLPRKGRLLVQLWRLMFSINTLDPFMMTTCISKANASVVSFLSSYWGSVILEQNETECYRRRNNFEYMCVFHLLFRTTPNYSFKNLFYFAKYPIREHTSCHCYLYVVQLPKVRVRFFFN